MIRAKDINRLLEEWKLVRGKKIEVLENPSSWREASSAFKERFRELKRWMDVAPILRFFYHPVSEEIKIWVGYDATHEDIVQMPALEHYWLGWILISNRIVHVLTSEGDDLTSSDEAPIPLAKFLRGLEFGHVDVEDYESEDY
jgi:hypothetical protein